MASDASIARNFGSPRNRTVAAMASEVILLSSGPTAMNASRDESRASSSIWFMPNCVSPTLSASTPEALRMTLSNATFAGVRPITPTLCPARSAICWTFGAGFLLELLSASPEGAHRTTTFLRTMATVCASAGISRSPRATARSALPAPSRARASTAPSVVIRDSLTVLLSLTNAPAAATITL